MIRINLTGAWYSSRNAGDQAILVAIRTLLESRIPDLRIQVIAAQDDRVRAEHGLEAISHTRNLPGVLWSALRCDGLVIGGGTPFYNDFKHMAFFWALASLCRMAGRRLVIYGASAQALNSRSARWFTRRILNMAHLVTVREDTTREQFEALNVRNRVVTTADPAITLAPCEETRVREILGDAGVPPSEAPLFAVCPHFFSNRDPYRVHHYEAFTDEAIARQDVVLAQTVDYLAQQGRVLVLPMNTDRPDSDVDAIDAIAARVSNVSGVYCIKQQYRPREIAGVLAACKLVVGVRLHALILAAAVGTPLVGIDYAPKVAGFMRLIGHTQCCCELRQLEFETLRGVIDRVLNDYEVNAQRFRECVAIARRRAEENAEMVARLFS